MLSFFNSLIRWSFYAVFFLVPIIFTGNTSELFEFNKMWLTFGLTLIIATSWICKMIIEKQIKIQKTPLDIFILFFLVSQLISTIFSADPHTSLWGYYSRFNGGFLSLLSYGFLYVAFVSNISPKNVLKYIYVSLASGVFVSLWGLPSHFGYDPTCLMFRGTFDVSCWTNAFQPKVRIFSTLGQPDWLAAYLVFLIPISASLAIVTSKIKNKLVPITFYLITALFYVDLLYTAARSGFVGFVASIVAFVVGYIYIEWHSFAKHAWLKSLKAHWSFLLIIVIFLVSTFFLGSPFAQFDKLTFAGLTTLFKNEKAASAPHAVVPQPAPSAPVEEFGGTDSGTIRLLVWKGAWNIFLHNPFFGTGAETFAYSYYLFRPAAHNMTSEWDYLYNKAHNEYLNYLATTGAVGFLTYMVMLGASVWFMAKRLKIDNIPLIIDQRKQHVQSSILNTQWSIRLLLLALLSAYISILVTNFFGFSVVIMNIYLLLTPAFALLLTRSLNPEKTYVFPSNSSNSNHVSEFAWVSVGIAWIVCAYLLYTLLQYWQADVSYAYGQNLDHVNQYQAAYQYLHDAVTTRPSEPTFQDELAVNDAVLATALFQQKDTANGTKLRDEAIAVSDSLVRDHPNVVTYWKSRVRIFYTLASVDPQYSSVALQAIQQASRLAPTDAKVWYNLGLLYAQSGDLDKAITTLQQTVALKPDYRDAYYAMALFYRQKALGGNINNKTVVDSLSEQKAVETMHYILNVLSPTDDLKIRDTLKTWGEQ